MTQQTAVEWFLEAIGYKQESDRITIINIHPDCDITDLIKQAKQMERQQLANAWDSACDSYILLEGNLVKIWKDFDKYYNDNYGSNNQI